ncbi:MAG TPA: carbohydrate-binding module family 20 domain-containing protein, partial [Chitinophagaceae bacterium]|nr:carbohydrate-binding module family 20 domain-containing protein [Chitinophagaceae bacterium]
MATEKINQENKAVEATSNGTLNGNHIIPEKAVRTKKTKKEGGVTELNAAPAKGTKTASAKKAADGAEDVKKPAKKSAPKKTVTKTSAPKKETPIEKVSKKSASKKAGATGLAEITLQLKFHTKFGQTLYITGNHEIFGDKDIARALPMQYLNNELWTVTISINRASIPAEGIVYNYFIKYEDGTISFDWGGDKLLNAPAAKTTEVFIADAWNFAGYYENAFYTEPFKHVLLPG